MNALSNVSLTVDTFQKYIIKGWLNSYPKPILELNHSWLIFMRCWMIGNNPSSRILPSYLRTTNRPKGDYFSYFWSFYLELMNNKLHQKKMNHSLIYVIDNIALCYLTFGKKCHIYSDYIQTYITHQPLMIFHHAITSKVWIECLSKDLE